MTKQYLENQGFEATADNGALAFMKHKLNDKFRLTYHRHKDLAYLIIPTSEGKLIMKGVKTNAAVAEEVKQFKENFNITDEGSRE